MGCDIHPAIEGRKYGRWKFMAEPYDARNYDFFGLLAGVRGRYEDGAIVCAKGRALPEDRDATTNLYADGDHGDSWCSLAEFKAFRPTVEEEAEPWPGDGIKYALKYWDRWIAMAEQVKDALDDDEATDEDVRFVFNFDN